MQNLIAFNPKADDRNGSSKHQNLKQFILNSKQFDAESQVLGTPAAKQKK